MATIGVSPGAPGATTAWLVGTLSDELLTGVSLNTVELLADQAKGPTTPVISTPLLKAVACNVICWLADYGTLFSAANEAMDIWGHGR